MIAGADNDGGDKHYGYARSKDTIRQIGKFKDILLIVFQWYRVMAVHYFFSNFYMVDGV